MSEAQARLDAARDDLAAAVARVRQLRAEAARGAGPGSWRPGVARAATDVTLARRRYLATLREVATLRARGDSDA